MKRTVIEIAPTIRTKLIEATQLDAQNCGSVCKDYQIMGNIYEPQHWFVRYTKLFYNGGEKHPQSVYRWICFNSAGERTECDPKFASVQTENLFFGGMYLVEELGNVFE